MRASPPQLGCGTSEVNSVTFAAATEARLSGVRKSQPAPKSLQIVLEYLGGNLRAPDQWILDQRFQGDLAGMGDSGLCHQALVLLHPHQQFFYGLRRITWASGHHPGVGYLAGQFDRVARFKIGKGAVVAN